MSWRWRESLVAMISWRYATHAAMVALALLNEPRPAPTLPDVVLDAIPRIDWIWRHNYHLWLAAWLPVALWLLARDRATCLRFLWVGGWLSLLRGVTIPLTGFGPVDGHDVNVGASAATLWHAWLAIVNPVTALTTDAPHVALTKDLFFSGHVATTFLLWLYCRRSGRDAPTAIAAAALAGHLLVTATVLLGHVHYTVDVVGAWAITYAVFAFAERRRAVAPPATE